MVLTGDKTLQCPVLVIFKVVCKVMYVCLYNTCHRCLLAKEFISSSWSSSKRELNSGGQVFKEESTGHCQIMHSIPVLHISCLVHNREYSS